MVNRRLKAFRVLKGYSQNELADKLGMSHVAYCRRERGQADISVEEAKKLMEILEADFNELF